MTTMECAYCGAEHASEYYALDYEGECYFLCGECGTEDGLTVDDVIEAIKDDAESFPLPQPDGESSSEDEEKQQSSLDAFADTAGD